MDQTNVVRIDAEHAAQVIHDFCSSVALPVQTSWTPAEAAELLKRLDFAVVPNTIPEFVRKGYIAPADPECLSPLDIYTLVACLMSRRRWKATPSRWDAMKTGIRLHVERSKAAGVEPFNDLDNSSVEDLLLQLVMADDRASRECLYEGLRIKLHDFAFEE